MNVRRGLGGILARYLARPLDRGARASTSPPEVLAATLRPGDVLLVDGNTRFSTAIKYLTQSTWSHAALYIGDRFAETPAGTRQASLIEADILNGVRTVPLSEYSHLHTRICRPVGLLPREIDLVIANVCTRIGYRYDLKNVVDLGRYLIRTPPVPLRHRRRLLALGSGDPTRAICSSLIAQAFQSIGYPILPNIEQRPDGACDDCFREILHIRHHSLFTPSDFDISPYFEIVKPTLGAGFDPHSLHWDPDQYHTGVALPGRAKPAQ